MIDKIKTYMKSYNMMDKGDRIVVGVSGGADSICLLHVLHHLAKESMLTLQVVHINHGIRKIEAQRDEEYVKEFCGQAGIEFQSFFYDVKRIAKVEGLSEEEAGRKVRYQTFLEVCKEKKCTKIAIAHNRNDNAETVLFHLFRGSGIKGLSGIEPNRVLSLEPGEITIIRPLLCVTRKEIEEYLAKEGVTYLIDSTNLTDDYSRNKIRNRILSYATKEINLQSIGNITEAATTLKEIDDYLSFNIRLRFGALVRKEADSYRIAVHELGLEHIVIQKGIVRFLLEELAGVKKDLEAKHVEAVLSLSDKQVGKQVNLPYDMIAEREYNDIKIYSGALHREGNHVLKEQPSMEVKIPGRTELLQKHKYIETKLINYKKNEPIPKSSCAKWFDYDKIENAVEIRTRKEGDYIQINGAGGRKKLKDYFIDHKVPQKQRDGQLLITDGNHVMWIPGAGERMSEKYKVDETTTKVLLMKMFDMEVNEDEG